MIGSDDRTQVVETDGPVIVIGSGPTGAMAAAKLVARGLDVVMLDAGTVIPPGMLVRAAGKTLYRKQDHSLVSTDRVSGDSKELYWASSLSHGGLSNFWTAAVPRFAPRDFTEGGRLDQRYVWPIGYDDLHRYYDEAERHLQVTAGGPILGVPSAVRRHQCRLPRAWDEVVQLAQSNGHGAGAIPVAEGSPWMFARRGTAFSSYHCVIEPLLAFSNFSLRSGAYVSRLLWSPVEGRVTAVEYHDDHSGELHIQRAAAVVVAAGTIDTTMILLRSTSSDFPTGLGNSHGLIGRYLHDHPREWWPASTARPMPALTHPIYVARCDHDLSEPLIAAAYTVSRHPEQNRIGAFLGAPSSQVGVQVFGTMVPEPEVGVSLEAAHSDGVRSQRATISLCYDDRAAQNMTASRDRLCDILGAAGLGISIRGPFHKLVPGSSVHLAGTVRMHADPKYGVLNGWNRMHEVDNVVVCDLSCFTTGPEKNPTATSMAMALRAADRLADDLASPALEEREHYDVPGS